ncbi:Fic family protein [Phaeobacter sp. A90a-4k]|uniref:Fic/DOC family protein n=1 Tax=unclassified Phaeobacter TaxID=2621772 RepID=UPI003A8BB9BE
MTDKRYCYPPDFVVLKNLLDIRDGKELDRAEREIVLGRTRQGAPSGNLDAQHIRMIHKHLFQDIYDWAGQYRTVEIGKGGRWFHNHQFIEQGMADVERTLQRGNFGQGMNADQYSDFASEVISNLNYVHPFREGNGRTQTEFLRQLSERAGHELDSEKIQRDVWITACHVSHSGTNDLLKAAITYAIDPERTKTGDKAQNAVREYLETARIAVNNLSNPQERQAGLDQLDKIARTYEVMMDRDTRTRFLPDQTRGDGRSR